MKTAALFETHNLSLNLDKGVVTSINYNSTSPAKETIDVLSGALNLAKEEGAAAFKMAKYGASPQKSGIPQCNTGKKIVKIRELSCQR